VAHGTSRGGRRGGAGRVAPGLLLLRERPGERWGRSTSRSPSTWSRRRERRWQWRRGEGRGGQRRISQPVEELVWRRRRSGTDWLPPPVPRRGAASSASALSPSVEAPPARRHFAFRDCLLCWRSCLAWIVFIEKIKWFCSLLLESV
jgi:hypothetical protein